MKEPTFPSILLQATLTARQVQLSSWMSDDQLVEYMQWKAYMGVEVLTPAILRRLHHQGLHVSDIYRVFKNNKKINYLSVEKRSRGAKNRTQRLQGLAR